MSTVQLRITWRQQRYGRSLVDRWYAYAFEYVGEECAGVWRERGVYRAEVWPPGGKAIGAYYRNPEKARQHVERWLHCHPFAASLAMDPRSSRGRSMHRPNPRLAQFLRLTGGSIDPF